MVRHTSLLPIAVAFMLVLFSGTAATTPGGLVDTGVVEGRVLDDHLEPIEGALLELVQHGTPVYTTMTDADGFYSFEEVDPDTYRLEASADGFIPAVKVATVEAGGVTKKDFLLEEEGPEPYVDGPHEWNGFISCWVSTVLDCSAWDDNHDTSSGTSLDEGLETATFLLEWETPGLLGAEELRLQIQDDEGNVLAGVTGNSPLKIRLDDGFEHASSLSFHVLPTDMSVGFQQTFTLWWALHYWAPAPDGYCPWPYS